MGRKTGRIRHSEDVEKAPQKRSASPIALAKDPPMSLCRWRRLLLPWHGSLIWLLGDAKALLPCSVRRAPPAHTSRERTPSQPR